VLPLHVTAELGALSLGARGTDFLVTASSSSWRLATFVVSDGREIMGSLLDSSSCTLR
jgi:hypothetical protein